MSKVLDYLGTIAEKLPYAETLIEETSLTGERLVGGPAAHHELSKDLRIRYRDGLAVALLGVCVNSGLVVFQLLLGLLSGSQALLAEALHTASDLASDIVCLLSILFAGQPEDEDHPYGHGKIESLFVFMVAILLAVAGFGMGYRAITGLIGEHVRPSFLAIIGAGGTLVLKEALFQITYHKGKELGSPTLIANAWHHRSDALSAGAALIGIGVAVFVPGFAFADSLAALVVVGMLGRVAWMVGQEAFHALVDTVPPEETLRRINNTARSVPGVMGVHNLRARYYGPGLMVDIDVEVDPALNVREGHDIAEKVREALQTGEYEVLNAQIHVDPYDPDHVH